MDARTPFTPVTLLLRPHREWTVIYRVSSDVPELIVETGWFSDGSDSNDGFSSVRIFKRANVVGSYPKKLAVVPTIQDAYTWLTEL